MRVNHVIVILVSPRVKLDIPKKIIINQKK